MVVNLKMLLQQGAVPLIGAKTVRAEAVAVVVVVDIPISMMIRQRTSCCCCCYCMLQFDSRGSVIRSIQ